MHLSQSSRNLSPIFLHMFLPQQVPASCCKSNLTDCSSANPVSVSEIWTDDCFVVGLSFVQEHAVYLAGVALGISSLMVGGMASSIHRIFVNLCFS